MKFQHVIVSFISTIILQANSADHTKDINTITDYKNKLDGYMPSYKENLELKKEVVDLASESISIINEILDEYEKDKFLDKAKIESAQSKIEEYQKKGHEFAKKETKSFFSAASMKMQLNQAISALKNMKNDAS
ncbi:hypothetical protein C0J52_25621 [Blattella germanica]|nr:hypothetical protein C0J52_25621 [Blattella germanica]